MVTRHARHLPAMASLVVGLLAIACSGGNVPQGQAAREPRVNVVSTSSIIGDWARQVGGEGVRVVDLVPPGVDPHTFQPGARDITNVADADLVLSVGLNLEGQWLRETLTNVRADDARRLVLGPLVDPRPAADEKGGPASAGAVLDPHFWMDPVRAKVAVSAIADELAEIDAGHAEEYRDNADVYLRKLDELDSWIGAKLRDLSPDDRILVTSHDSLGYFADRYGFRVVGAVIPGVSTERDPSAGEMAMLVDAIRQYQAKAIFVEASVSDRMARRISEETGVPVVGGLLVGTLGPPGTDVGTYEGMMRRNVEIIVGALR
ncbi:MAG: zinc ABC transporter substrate-binding protein [Chloroflexi bacterium]|nr:zinc ABC transporter substrate-binding protein [Chloroflexota bacterium]